MTASARVLVPVRVTNDMLSTGTSIAEPDLSSGEVAWTASSAYALADQRTSNGSAWECVQAHTGRTALPEADAAYWLRIGPSNRMMPFDDYSNTKSRATGSLSFVLQPGFFNGLVLYGPEGASYGITIKDAPGGSIIMSRAGDLYAQAIGFYELLFSPLLPLTQLSFDGAPLAPLAEVTITIASAAGQPVALGTIKIGDWREFIGDGAFGGAEYGAESDRKSYTFRRYNEDGTYKTIVRPASRDVRCSITIDAAQAMYADAILEQIIDVAVPFEAVGLPRYGYLSTLGFVSGSVRADSFGTTSINLKVKGNI